MNKHVIVNNNVCKNNLEFVLLCVALHRIGYTNSLAAKYQVGHF